MLKLDQTITVKIIFSFIALFLFLSFFIAYISTYFSASIYVLALAILAGFITVWGLILYLVKKKDEKVNNDVQELLSYLQKISDKNYGAVIKTKHFSEFLQIELLLKNIIKRLHKKDHKK